MSQSMAAPGQQSGGLPDTAKHRAIPPGTLVSFVERPHFRPYWALATDLSSTGIRLLLARPLELGKALLVQLFHNGERDTPYRLARVAHAASLTDGGWEVACQFDRSLSDEDLAVAREATGLRQ
jgi:hypothetical protein